MTEREEAAGLAAVLTATLAFSWGAILIKSIAMTAPAIVFWRLLIGVVVLGTVALAIRAPWPRRWHGILVAGVLFGVHQLCFFTANRLTSIAIVTLIGALQPILVSFVSHRTVGESVPPGLRLWALVAVAGVAFVVHANWADESRGAAGDLLAVVNVFLFTAYFLAVKRVRQAGVAALTATIGIFLVAVAVVGPFLLLVRTAGVAPGNVAPTVGLDVVLLTTLALVPGNGHLLVNWAHSRVSAALSSLVLTGMPILASIWAHLIFGEPYGWRHVAGMLLVVAAVEGGRRAERRRALELKLGDEPSL